MKFEISDGWLLVSLWGAREPCDRDLLNKVGDAFSHAVFLASDVEEGMRRLAKEGYAETLSDGRMAVTETGRVFVESLNVNGRRHVDLMQAVKEALLIKNG